MSATGWRWPVRLEVPLPSGELLVLRPLERRDRAAWLQLRSANRAWLDPWESSVPGETRPPLDFGPLRRSYDRAGRAQIALPFVLDVGGRPIGQMHLFDVLGGGRQIGMAGYWLGREHTGRGYATWGLAALIDHALLDVGLHRVEVAIRPENAASIRVAERLRLPEEGLQRGLIYVDGAWRHHRSFAVLADDLGPGGYAPGGLLALLRRV